jgi:hypothetical protein
VKVGRGEGVRGNKMWRYSVNINIRSNIKNKIKIITIRTLVSKSTPDVNEIIGKSSVWIST